MGNTFVLGYDDSLSANAALAETIRRAPPLGADVCVVFGYYISAFGGPAVEGESTDFRSQLEGVGSRAVGRAVADLEAAGITVSSRIQEGRPADVLMAVATEIGAGTIVVGTVGENPVSGALLGSVVLKLVQRSSTPLLIVPTQKGPKSGRS
ncbi:MAG: universal stress protein [Thermoleophilia bacterium]|nr:universal stress protein [Thermoleophilia bacterium]